MGEKGRAGSRGGFSAPPARMGGAFASCFLRLCWWVGAGGVGGGAGVGQPVGGAVVLGAGVGGGGGWVGAGQGRGALVWVNRVLIHATSIDARGEGVCLGVRQGETADTGDTGRSRA